MFVRRRKAAVRALKSFGKAIVVVCEMAVDCIGDYLPKGARMAAPRSLPMLTQGAALDVPCKIQLNTYNCGLVAVLTLIETFRPRWRGHDGLVGKISTNNLWGTDTKEVLVRLREHGVGTTRGFGLTFVKIKNAIDAGYPILAIIVGEFPSRDNPYGVHHWCVVYGYDFDGKHVYVSNATSAKRWFSSRLTWRHFNRCIIPRGAFWRCHGLARR